MSLSTVVNPTMSTARVGHVYVLHDQKRGIVKIGRSRTPSFRLASLRTISGLQDSEEFISPRVYDCVLLESEMHRIFEAHRIAGEWFRVDFLLVVNKLNEICPPEVSNFEYRQAKNFDQKKGDKILKGILSHRSAIPKASFDDAFISSLSKLEEIYAFENSMLHAYGALSDFIADYSEPHESMVQARDHLAKSIELLAKAFVGIRTASKNLSDSDANRQPSILSYMIGNPSLSEQVDMKFEGMGAEWAAQQMQEQAA